MPIYHINNSLGGSQQNMSASYKTLALVTASNATQVRRVRVLELLIGTNGTPADNAVEFDLSRQTAAGTATAVTPLPLEPADPAALAAAAVNATAEGTITANSSLFYLGMNQRASYRWTAAPGSELVSPATNANGFALRARSPAYTGTATGGIFFSE